MLGGYLTEHLTWRAVFAINLPIGALAAYLALRLPASARYGTARFRPDVAGALLFAVAAGALLLALTSASERLAWTSTPMLALLGSAAAASAALLWWERRASDPVIPLRLLAMPPILRSNAMVFCFAAALFDERCFEVDRLEPLEARDGERREGEVFAGIGGQFDA